MGIKHILIPQECLRLNPKFNKRMQGLVICSGLVNINNKIRTSNRVRIKVRSLGTIFTRTNRIDKMARYHFGYDKKSWKEKTKKKEFSEKYLLF